MLDLGHPHPEGPMSPLQTLGLEELANATGGKHKHHEPRPEPDDHGASPQGGLDPHGAGIAPSAGPASGTDVMPTGRTASSYRGSFR
jgi:hypothetical protein